MFRFALFAPLSSFCSLPFVLIIHSGAQSCIYTLVKSLRTFIPVAPFPLFALLCWCHLRYTVHRFTVIHLCSLVTQPLTRPFTPLPCSLDCSSILTPLSCFPISAPFCADQITSSTHLLAGPLNQSLSMPLALLHTLSVTPRN